MTPLESARRLWRQSPVVQVTSTAYAMGVDFVERDDLPDTIPLMREPVEGWSVYSGAEGESPQFEDFFVDRVRAEGVCDARDVDGHPVLFDAFVFDAILLPEGLVTSNDFEIRNHEHLAERIAQWRAQGWDGSS